MKYLLILLVIVLLSGCGTIKGLSHDISWAAGKIDDSITIPE